MKRLKHRQGCTTFETANYVLKKKSHVSYIVKHQVIQTYKLHAQLADVINTQALIGTL
jgi:hypothetical protein